MTNGAISTRTGMNISIDKRRVESVDLFILCFVPGQVWPSLNVFNPHGAIRL